MKTDSAIYNSNWTVVKVAAALCVIAAIGIFIPSLVGMDCFDGACGIGAILFFISIMFAVTAFVWAALARVQDRIIKDPKPLARWQLSDAEWITFVREEYARDKKEKLFLFRVVAGFSLFFAIVFPIFDTENGYFVSLVMLGLIVLIGAVASFSVYGAHSARQKSGGLVIITEQGVYLGGRTYAWGMVGGMLRDVAYEKEYIELSYNGGKTEYTTRVPVPQGKEKEASMAVRVLEDVASRSKPGILQKY